MVALLRGGAWIEISFKRNLPEDLSKSHSFAGVRGLKSKGNRSSTGTAWSHSFAGVRGLKYRQGPMDHQRCRVALLRGGAWIEINKLWFNQN